MRTALHTRLTARRVAGPLAALGAAAVLASPAAAQGRWGRGGTDGDGRYNTGGYGNAGYNGARTLYQWSGRVDRDAVIVMQNGDVRTRLDSYDNDAGARVRVGAELPPADGVVDVRVAEGRGRVDVVEQPSRRNGYRAVVRVRDDDAGAGFYRLVAMWRPTGGYGDGRPGDGRDGDGRYGDGRYGDARGTGGYGAAGGAYGGSGVLHWRGRVDDVVEIRLQGDRIDTRTLSGDGASGVRVQRSGGVLPARDVTVRVADRSGRGRVLVVQQPHAWNGYTAVVRVEDRDRGAAWYDLDVSW